MFNYCFRYNVAYTFRIWLMPLCTLGEIEIVKAATNVKKIKIAIASLLILPEKRTLSLCLVMLIHIMSQWKTCVEIQDGCQYGHQGQGNTEMYNLII